jgi:hypothetical protein
MLRQPRSSVPLATGATKPRALGCLPCRAEASGQRNKAAIGNAARTQPKRDTVRTFVERERGTKGFGMSHIDRSMTWTLE